MRPRGSVIAHRELNWKGHGFSHAAVRSPSTVIPSEEDRSLVNGLRSRGTCFSGRHFKNSARKTGSSTLRIDSQASRFALIEMTVQGRRIGAAEATPFQSRPIDSIAQAGQHA